jgi:hypothetical protein
MNASNRDMFMQLRTDYPGWCFWLSDRGRLYAVRNGLFGSSQGTTVDADGIVKLREEIHATERRARRER